MSWALTGRGLTVRGTILQFPVSGRHPTKMKGKHGENKECCIHIMCTVVATGFVSTNLPNGGSCCKKILRPELRSSSAQPIAFQDVHQLRQLLQHYFQPFNFQHNRAGHVGRTFGGRPVVFLDWTAIGEMSPASTI